MAPVPDPAFRSLLADCSRSAFADFVADLWRARGREVRREGDRLGGDDRELRPVRSVDARSAPDDAVLVAATEPPADAGDAVIGPSDLRRMLLYDAPRERAADLFETHFGRPLDDDRSDLTPAATGPPPDATGGSETAPTGEAEPDTTEEAERDTTERAGPDDPPDESPIPSRRARPGGRLARATARLPRDRGDVRSLLGDRRVQVAVVAALAVLAAAGWGLFLYQPAPEMVTEPPFDVRSSPPVDDSYRADSQVYVTGNGTTRMFTLSRTYAPGDPAVGVRTSTVAYDSVGEGADQLREVEYERGDVSYVRRSWTNGSNYRRLTHEEDTVWTNDATRSSYMVHRQVGGVEAIPFRTVPGWALRIFPYEHRGTTIHDGREVVRFVPTSGWSTSPGPGDETRSIRVQATSGEVLVDAETGALLSVDVEATFVRAATWAEALTGPSHDISVHYRVESDVERPEAPPWVAGLDENATTENGMTENERG